VDVDPSLWMPLGHSTDTPVHESTPGRPALPGTDPSATAPAMAVGASLPGGPSTGPMPVQTGESSTRGFRVMLAERLAKAKSMTSTTSPDTDQTTVQPSQRNGAVPPASAPPAPDTHGGHGARGLVSALGFDDIAV